MQLKHIIRTVLNVVPLLLLPLGAESGLASPKDFNTDRSDNTVYVMPDEFVCQTNADGMLATYAVRGHRELDIIAWSEWEDPGIRRRCDAALSPIAWRRPYARIALNL